MQFKPVSVMLEGANRRKSCAGCVYRRGIGSRGDRYKVCHYCIDTGMPAAARRRSARERRWRDEVRTGKESDRPATGV